jgi:hypothetical protein
MAVRRISFSHDAKRAVGRENIFVAVGLRHTTGRDLH